MKEKDIIEEIWRILNETARRQEETARRQEETARRQEESARRQEESARRQEESEKEIGEIRALIRKTDLEIEKVGKMVGELTDGWGKFVEGLSEPSIERYFEKLDIKLWEVGPKRRRIGKEEMQIDLLCVGMDKNKKIVIAMEVKSYLTRKKIEKFIKDLKRFKELFFEYRDIELRGGVGGVRMSDDAVKFAQNKGLYVFSVSDDIMVNINPPDFKPNVW